MRRGYEPRRPNSCRFLEHGPEKHALGLRPDGWVPVFPRDKRETFARRSCSNNKIERDDNSKKSHHALERLPLEEIRADIRLFLDRIVVAIDAVGDQRVARENRILVELDRVQADDSSLFAPIPFERRRALRLLAGRNRVGKHRTLDKGLHSSSAVSASSSSRRTSRQGPRR